MNHLHASKIILLKKIKLLMFSVHFVVLCDDPYTPAAKYYLNMLSKTPHAQQQIFPGIVSLTDFVLTTFCEPYTPTARYFLDKPHAYEKIFCDKFSVTNFICSCSEMRKFVIREL